MRSGQKHPGKRRYRAALVIGIASGVLAIAACAPGATSNSAGASPATATTAATPDPKDA